jgi:acyl-CoA thioesterase
MHTGKKPDAAPHAGAHPAPHPAPHPTPHHAGAHHAAPSYDADPQAVAEAVRARMYAEDSATRSLGIAIEAIGPGTSRATMLVRAEMLNGHRTCHGGFITTLADSAFAFACNSRNQVTVAAGLVVEFLAPAHEGDRLVAEAHEVTLTGVTGVYDIAVSNQHGRKVAVMRGRSHALRGRHVVDASDIAAAAGAASPMATPAMPAPAPLRKEA